VPRVNHGIIRQGKKFFSDSAKKKIRVATRQIPPAHPTGKKHIPADEMSALRLIKTQAAGAVAGHLVNVEVHAQQSFSFSLTQNRVGLEGFDLQSKSVFGKSIRSGDKGQGIGCDDAGALVFPEDLCGIDDMVKVAVCEHQHPDFFTFESCRRALWSVKKQVASRCWNEKSVRFKHATRKFFELKHKNQSPTCDKSATLKSILISTDTKLMTFTRTFILLLAIFLLQNPAGAGASPSPDPGQVASTVARILEQGHYTRQKLDETLSRQFLENYLRALDYNRLYFLQSDIDEFEAKYADSLHKAVLGGDLTPVREIHGKFRERLESRIAQVKEMIKEPFDFSSNRKVEINRKDAAWPRDEADADRLWRNRIEGEMLAENLNDARIDPPVKVLTRRYDQILRNFREQEEEDELKIFLTALAQTYDPHSDYLSPRDMENFAISMRLSLVGVGAVLRSDEGYARVMEVVPGGPADRDGRLRVNDRIAAVAQGEKDFEDTVDLRLDRVVEKIRGEKGTTVRLMVIPANAADSAQREVIEIVRDEVQLKDQEARAELIEMPADEGLAPARIGWISLPSFYSSNVDPQRGSVRKSTTEDVSALLNRLTREGIDGLVIDLRRDGGGSLEEAINLTGLFIPEGPVVQVKDSNGRVSVQADNSGRTLYNGPMVVLMNRLSASASEIFAAALQDYGRALIVGDERSFGKGTVQQVIEVGRFMPLFSRGSDNAGNLKLTVQKFYRVKGGSTQLRGVESDIILPSTTDSNEIGEGSLINPLAYDEVAPRLISPSPIGPLAFVEELRTRSAARVAKEPEFQFITEDMTRLKERIDNNRLSLNKQERKAEVDGNKARRDARELARRQRGPALDAIAYEITLENIDTPQLERVAFDRENKKQRSFEEMELEFERGDELPAEEDAGKDDTPPVPDAIRIEALNIMRDMIDLVSPSRTAKANPAS